MKTRAILYTYCDYNFNACGIFEKMISFTKFSTKIWNKENPVAPLIVGNKVQKTRFLMIVID